MKKNYLCVGFRHLNLSIGVFINVLISFNWFDNVYVGRETAVSDLISKI